MEQPQMNNPELENLINLLNANPDRIEGVYKYTKGIIGNDTIPNQGEISSVQENRNYNLDEIIDDVLSNRDIKTTISKPIQKLKIKDKMFKPSF